MTKRNQALTLSSAAPPNQARPRPKALSDVLGHRRLRVLLVTSQDSGGGAPRAIHRLYKALQENCASQADTYLRVIHKTHDDPRVLGGKPERNLLEYAEYFLRTRFRKYFPRKPYLSDNKLLHSRALYATGLGREIDSLRPDIVMLGWLGNSTLSIEEIGRLKVPYVWRLSDMWMFAGAEHYTRHRRFESGYSRASRPPGEEGPDINRETFKRKVRSWTSPRHVISPSSWMAGLVSSSRLTKTWSSHVIPNAIDTEKWRPADRSEARKRLGLPTRANIALFGAGGGLRDEHKGGDLFLNSLNALAQVAKSPSPKPGQEVVAAIFGEEGRSYSVGQISVIFLGRLSDRELRDAYSSADVTVVPSRLDNLPSTAIEAQSCGCPVIAFQTAGLPDVVIDGVTGYLVEPFDTEQLASAMWSLLADGSLARSMGEAGRRRAESEWAPGTIAWKYLEVFRSAAGRS